MPIWDPQNDFPGISWIGLSLGIPTFFKRKPWISRNLPAFVWRWVFGVPKSRFWGKMNLTCWAAVNNLGTRKGNTSRPKENNQKNTTSRVLFCPAEIHGEKPGISVSTQHRWYGHRLRTPFCRPCFRDSCVSPASNWLIFKYLLTLTKIWGKLTKRRRENR